MFSLQSSMKKFSISLVISFFFLSFSCFADWIKFGDTKSGATFYYSNVKRHNNFIYYEEITDYLKPDEDGTICRWQYTEVNCNNYLWKRLNFQSYTRPMCKGKGLFEEKKVVRYLKNNEKWKEGNPGEIGYEMVKTLCKKNS